MHSRIYQITTDPVPADEYLSEGYFYEHWFVGSIADYVAGGLKRESEIDSFKELLVKRTVAVFHGDDCFSILPHGKEAYFRYAYADFNDAVKKAASISLEDFAGNGECSSLVYRIKNSFCDKFGPYVSSDEFDTIPLDDFIRDAELGKRYYIGGILDYHW